MALKLSFIPSKEIEGVYDVVNTVNPLLIHTKIGDVNLCSITLAQAHALYAAGTDYLKPVKAKAASKKEAIKKSLS